MYLLTNAMIWSTPVQITSSPASKPDPTVPPFLPNHQSSPWATPQRNRIAVFSVTSFGVILRWPGSRGSLELVGGRNATWVVWEMICNNDNSTILSHQTSTIASSSLPYLALQLTKPENSMMRCPESALPYKPATGLASSANKKLQDVYHAPITRRCSRRWGLCASITKRHSVRWDSGTTDSWSEIVRTVNFSVLFLAVLSLCTRITKNTRRIKDHLCGCQPALHCGWVQQAATYPGFGGCKQWLECRVGTNRLNPI